MLDKVADYFNNAYVTSRDEAIMPNICSAAEIPDLQGRFYQDCLRDLHKAVRPKTYLEIGTLTGDTLRLASCRSIAIDPSFQLTEPSVNSKPALHMFQMTSDAFFAAYDPIALLGGRVDLAFLDGMHLFEFLLRDFINTEHAVHRGSVVVLHDCVPLDPFMAIRDINDRETRSRSRHPQWWTGDVWKVVTILQEYRRDLTVTLFDAPPTGLAVVTGLDPANRTLSESYADIVVPNVDSHWHDDSLGLYMATTVLTPTSRLLEYLPRNRNLLSEVSSGQ